MASTDTATGTLERHGLSDDQLRAIFRNMLLQRQLEIAVFNSIGKERFPLRSAARDTKPYKPEPQWRSIAGATFSPRIIAISDSVLGIGLSPYEILLLDIFARASDHNGGRQFPNHYSSQKRPA